MINKDHNFSILFFFLPMPVGLAVNHVLDLIRKSDPAGMMPVNTWMLWIHFVNSGLFWMLMCYFLVRSKGLPVKFLLWGLIGPPGLIILVLLEDHAHPKTCYLPGLARLKDQISHFRPVAEIVFFLAMIVAAWLLLGLMTGLENIVHARLAHISVAEYIKQCDASSGMWAFHDMFFGGTIFLFLYLIRPRVISLLMAKGEPR